MKYLIRALILVLAFLGFFFILKSGMEKQEIHECLTWKEQSTESNLFYLTQWQKEQCDSYNIEIHTQVK